MTIREAEDKLFEEWNARVPDVVRDGVVDESAYISTNPKLVFVLKEANDFAGGDLREYLRGSNEGGTLNNVVRWTRSILSLPNIPAWKSINCVYQPERTEWLPKVGWINIKKQTGMARAVDADLAAAVNRNGDLLVSQISLYGPDIIICCGGIVFDLLCFSAMGFNQTDLQETSLGVQYVRQGSGKPIIRFHHPNTQWPAHILTYGLCFAVAEIQGMKLELRNDD